MQPQNLASLPPLQYPSYSICVIIITHSPSCLSLLTADHHAPLWLRLLSKALSFDPQQWHYGHWNSDQLYRNCKHFCPDHSCILDCTLWWLMHTDYFIGHNCGLNESRARQTMKRICSLTRVCDFDRNSEAYLDEILLTSIFNNTFGIVCRMDVRPKKWFSKSPLPCAIERSLTANSYEGNLFV